MELRPRETVILAEHYEPMVAWYRDVLCFRVVRKFEGAIRFANLETTTGIRIGIAPASESGVEPGDRARATVIPQVEVDDVRALLARVEHGGGSVPMPAAFDERDGFWFGAFADPEGNRFWVVDPNCP